MKNFHKLKNHIETHHKLDHTDMKAVDALEMFVLLLTDIAKKQIHEETKYFKPGTKTYKVRGGYLFISCYDKDFEKNSITRHVTFSNYFFLTQGILKRLFLDTRIHTLRDRKKNLADFQRLENEETKRWLNYRNIAGAHTKYGQKPDSTSRSILRYSVSGAFSLGYQFRDGYVIVGGSSDHQPGIEEEVSQSPIYLGKDWDHLEKYIQDVIEGIMSN